jgi:hypothetical protein
MYTSKALHKILVYNKITNRENTTFLFFLYFLAYINENADLLKIDIGFKPLNIQNKYYNIGWRAQIAA